MAKSFLKRITPDRQRWKLIDWPFPIEDGEERPKLKLRVLGQNESEAAYLAAADHFKARKDIRDDSKLFLSREHAEIVFRAYSIDGEPIDDDVDELAKQPSNIVGELYITYVQFYNDVAAAPTTQKQFADLVELLKKNMDPAPLYAFPASWLIGCISILVNPPAPSTPDSLDGS